MSTPADRPEMVAKLEKLNRKFAKYIALNEAMGIEMVEFGDGTAVQRLPYRDELVGNPDTGVLHGGAVTALMDSCCGAAAFMALAEPNSIATLDLRIDYLKPATPGQAVLARAECFKTTRSVAFVRCIAYHTDPADAIASAAASFMLGTPLGIGPGATSS